MNARVALMFYLTAAGGLRCTYKSDYIQYRESPANILETLARQTKRHPHYPLPDLASSPSPE